MLNNSKELAKSMAPSAEQLAQVKDKCDRYYGQCLAGVFKEYLPHIAECYSVEDYQGLGSPTESVASFEISKLVLEKDDKVLEKLKNVYQLLSGTGNSIAMIINRSFRQCRIFFAVGTEHDDSELAKNLAMNVRDAFLGNFPGSECDDVHYYSDGRGSAFNALNENTGFGVVDFNSIGIVSNIATDFSEEFSTQGIEKLIDGISLGRDEEYTLILVGRSMPANQLMQKKNELYRLYTGLSPFASVQRNWSFQESKSWSQNLGVSGGTELPGAIPGLPRLNVGAFASVGHGTAKTTGEGGSVTLTEYGVKHMLDTIEKQMERLELCEALGLWQFSAYILSPDVRLVSEASHMYLSLTQGNKSNLERPAINIWNAQGRNPATIAEITKLRSYLTHLEHPQFVKKEGIPNTFFNQENWPKRTTCTADLSGEELVKAINIPRSSVPGLPVIECAPFGREVSSYDATNRGDIHIGCIHHMHHDEEMSVELSSDSLTSHVFVTGSTGSGKSNTVYRLLDECSCNFLVIEPAKGEYRYEFADCAKVYGTNPMTDDLLRINPFEFPEGIHIYEHIDRILEVFNVCWPMYAAMPAVLKEAIIRAYEKVGWDMTRSTNSLGRYYPTFADVCREVDAYIDSSDYSADTCGDYKGSLKTRLESMTNGINRLLFCNGSVSDEELFDGRVIADLSRVGSSENKALIMGILVIKLQERRMCQRAASNETLKHITVLEEAHNLLRNSQTIFGETGGGIASKSVEMISNAIAEMRTYGEGFIIVDQSPGLLDMAAIRNTNTKIIMRLPDEGDRQLVGKAAGLNDGQIAELAKLQRGVAAVYQNEWIEPVLCHIGKHERKETVIADGYEYAPESEPLSSQELECLNTCLIYPRRIDMPEESDFLHIVEKSGLQYSMKRDIFLMARSSYSDRKNLYCRIAYDYFDMEDFFDANEVADGSDILQELQTYLSQSWIFEDLSDWDGLLSSQLLFAQMMVFERGERLRKLRTPRSVEEIGDLSRTALSLSALMGGR